MLVQHMIICKGGLYAHPMCRFRHFFGGGINPAPTIRFNKVCAIIYNAVYNYEVITTRLAIECIFHLAFPRNCTADLTDNHSQTESEILYSWDQNYV